MEKGFQTFLFQLIWILFFTWPLNMAYGQIVININDLEDYFQHERVYHVTEYRADNPDELQNLVNLTGAGQTYDLTSTTFTNYSEYTLEMLDMPIQARGADHEHFSDADLMVHLAPKKAVSKSGHILPGNGVMEEFETTEFANSFFSMEDDGFYQIGTVYWDDDGGDPHSGSWQAMLRYDPALHDNKAPVTYETEWSSSTTQVITQEDQNFSIPITRENKIDGYGTLLTDSGSDEVLRGTVTTVSTLPVVGETTVEYIQFSNKSGSLSAIIDLDDEENVISGRYWTFTDKNALSTVSDRRPQTFRLGQNYPNPFNPATHIRYHLEESGIVSLVVYDITGRPVTTLVNHYQAMGQHEVEFHAGELASGVYWYQLRSGRFSETRQMLLVK